MIDMDNPGVGLPAPAAASAPAPSQNSELKAQNSPLHGIVLTPALANQATTISFQLTDPAAGTCVIVSVLPADGTAGAADAPPYRWQLNNGQPQGSYDDPYQALVDALRIVV